MGASAVTLRDDVSKDVERNGDDLDRVLSTFARYVGLSIDLRTGLWIRLMMGLGLGLGLDSSIIGCQKILDFIP
jgi:hypothetical protein